MVVGLGQDVKNQTGEININSEPNNQTLVEESHLLYDSLGQWLKEPNRGKASGVDFGYDFMF